MKWNPIETAPKDGIVKRDLEVNLNHEKGKLT